MTDIATVPVSRAPAQLISRVPYLPGLDGMRALAVLAVMVYHAHLWLPAGFLGVEVFFVISGYLITLLLIAEHEREGRIGLRPFWVRRFRRLLPALYLTLLIVGLYCLLFFRDALGKFRGDLFGAVTYVTNWYQIWDGKSYTGEFDFVPLRHLWSLAVEEQFYLVWPLVMLLVLRKGRDRLPRVGLWLFCISITITVAAALFFHPGASHECAVAISGREQLGAPCTVEIFGRAIEKNNFLYLGTLSRVGGILLGAGFAMLWRPAAIMRGPLRHMARRLDILGLVGLAVLGFLVVKFELFSAFADTWFLPLFRGGLLLTDIATLLVIAAVTHRDTVLAKVLGNRLLRWIGTRSYGLYLFHWPIYQFIRKEAGIQLSVRQMLFAWMLAGVIAEFSYRVIELPIRRGALSRWWRGRSTWGAVQRQRLVAGLACASVVIGVLGVNVATSDVKCTNDNECSFEEGQSVAEPSSPTNGSFPVATQGNTNPSTVDGSTPSIPDGTATTVEQTTTTAVPVKYSIYAIGDSVMLGAAPVMQSAGIVTDAAVSRQAATGADILEGVAAQGSLGDYVVIHLGTNGPMSAATIDRLMAATASVKRVVVLTIFVPRKWTDANNELIRALPPTHPNVVVIDWQAEAFYHRELLAGDGYHLKGDEARKYYTNVVLVGLGLPPIP